VIHFFVLAFLVAMVLGGSQALSRALFARLIPQDRTSEFFGFFAVSERFATIMGPILFFISATITGSSRTAILGILILFVAGGYVLSLVDEEEGMRVVGG
jgi:UMF1 family MFS transporter